MAKKRLKNSKLEKIDAELRKIEREEGRIEREEKIIEKKIDKLGKEEKEIEKAIFKLGKIDIKREHLFEFLRASAGAFLGVGLGRGLIGLDNIARTLPWANVIGILVFILGLSSLLIYKDQREKIKEDGTRIIFRRLFFIYLISLLIEFLSLLLFNVQYGSTEVLVKMLIVGSYTAMASAVTFSLAK